MVVENKTGKAYIRADISSECVHSHCLVLCLCDVAGSEQFTGILNLFYLCIRKWNTACLLDGILNFYSAPCLTVYTAKLREQKVKIWYLSLL